VIVDAHRQALAQETITAAALVEAVGALPVALPFFTTPETHAVSACPATATANKRRRGRTLIYYLIMSSEFSDDYNDAIRSQPVPLSLNTFAPFQGCFRPHETGHFTLLKPDIVVFSGELSVFFLTAPWNSR
jgi:hypothetical protein